MKNRDKWITIAFLVFILAIPLVTVVRNLLPSQQENELTDEEQAILEQNGTLINGTQADNKDNAQAGQNSASKENWIRQTTKVH